MRNIKRIISLLLMLCILASLPTMALQVSAADITSSLSINSLAAGSVKVLSDLEKSISGGTKDDNGVYYAYSFPTKLSFAEGTLGSAEFAVMAATALREIEAGSASTTAIAYQDITLNTNEILCGSGNTLTKGQYLDLAERAQKYGSVLSALPSSFNRPSDGTNTYDGRISVYSLIHIFAEALAAYSTAGTLPESVTFLPAHVSGVTNEEGVVTTTAAPTTTEPPTTVPPTTVPPTTTAPTGATTVVSTTKITLSVIALEGYQIENWIKTNMDLPSYCELNTGDKFSPAQTLYMMCKAVADINSNKLTNTYSAGTIDEAPGSNGDQTTGNLKKAEYLDMASRIATFMDNNGAAPNYCTSSTLGTVQYEECVYLYARILSYYYQKGSLPDTIKSFPWGTDGTENSGSGSSSSGGATFGYDYSAYSQYLKATSNCQSTNSTIISVAKTGMKYTGGNYASYKNPSNTQQAMANLFEYLNDKTTYDGYYDTQKGAVKTWTSKYGNCCDMAHLMNACARSLGVPGRYLHGYCRFSSGLQTGHVWSEVRCGSSWKTADLVSDYAYLGYKTNTTLSFYSYYATLPF